MMREGSAVQTTGIEAVVVLCWVVLDHAHSDHAAAHRSEAGRGPRDEPPATPSVAGRPGRAGGTGRSPVIAIDRRR
jgi:hypothetical protein